jgi:putative transposase
MSAKSYPTNLTDVEWNHIKDLIPPPKPGGRKRELDIRAVANAIFYVVDGGIKWHLLPHEYPNYDSVYWYFSQWRERGDWQRSHDTLRAQVSPERRPSQASHSWLWDAPSVKTTEVGGERGFDKGKNVKGRKHHMRKTTNGCPRPVRR